MKKLFLPTLRLSAILAISFLVTTCTQEAREDLLDEYTDGISLNIDTDIFRSPLSLQFVDANPEMANTPQGLSVRIEGPDKDLIYSTDGKRNPQAIDGILEVALDMEHIITPEDPLELTIVAEAPGYLKTVHNVVLYDTSFQFIPVNMVNLNAPPAGVSVETGMAPAGIDGVTEDVSFTTPMPNGKEEEATVSLKSGTKVMDADGNELVGDIEVQLAHFDNRSEASLNAFPGGFTATNVIDQNGEPMEPLEFVTAGFVAIDMFVGNTEVKEFSEPVEVSIGVNPNTMDPETDQMVKEGDRIPVWSLNDDTGQWQEEGEAVVTTDANGELVATFEVTHLSWWNIDWFWRNRCSWWRPITINIQSNWNTFSEGAPLVTARLVDANTGRRLGWQGNYYLLNNRRMRFYSVPDNRPVKLQILDGTHYYCQEVLFESNTFTTNCNSSVNIDFSTFNQNNQLTIDARMSGLCGGGGNSDFIIRPSRIWVYYKKSDCPYFSYLTYVWNGRFFTNRLNRGETYDFFVYYGGQRFHFNDITVETQTITLDDYKLDIVIDNNRANLIFENIRIPEEYCDIFLGG